MARRRLLCARLALYQGKRIMVGYCPMCGRWVGTSCNQIGPKCRYEGAQFNRRGILVGFTWARKEGRITNFKQFFATLASTRLSNAATETRARNQGARSYDHDKEQKSKQARKAI